MINLDRLCEVASEWAHAERAAVRSGAQDRVLGGESNAQESEIPLSSTESIQNFKKSSRDTSKTSQLAPPQKFERKPSRVSLQRGEKKKTYGRTKRNSLLD
ncbi:hypothetical protein [Massilia phosphatilytica]